MSKALAKNRPQLLMTNRLVLGWKKNNREIKSQRSDSKGYTPIEESKMIGINKIVGKNHSNNKAIKLREKCLYLELFWHKFLRIWTEYGEIIRISLYSIRIQERITPNMDRFYAVVVKMCSMCKIINLYL